MSTSVFRRRDLRHFGLVVEPGLGVLKRGGHVEDRLAVLNRLNAARRKMVAVARPIDLVDDRRGAVPAPQKIRVQRMHRAIIDGRGRGDQGLTQHLAAEHLRAADIAAFAAKQIELEPFERHHLDANLRAIGSWPKNSVLLSARDA